MVTKPQPVITRTVKDREGNLIENRALGERESPTNVDMTTSRKALMGAVAAQQVLSAGGKLDEAVTACLKAREGTPEEPIKADEPEQELDPTLRDMIKYVHSIARLHSGRFEELTPLGMLEVAMLCPYPVCSFEEWKQKIKVATGQEQE